jgi:hypothetical protein
MFYCIFCGAVVFWQSFGTLEGRSVLTLRAGEVK